MYAHIYRHRANYLIMAKVKYQIKPEFLGADVWTVAPAYDRKEGGKFTLDEKLSQTDLGYLFEVIQHEAVSVVE